MITLNNIAVGNDWEWIFWAVFPRQSTLFQVNTFQFTRTHFPFTKTQSVSKTRKVAQYSFKKNGKFTI
jgi:hypothetical protein